MNYFKISKFFLLLPLVGIAIVSTSTLFPFIVGKYVWFRSTIDIALILFIIGLIFSPQATEYKTRIKKLIRHPLVIAVTVFVIAFLLACLFGIDPAYSFWSNFERGEGGIQLLHLWFFFFLLVVLFKDEDDWRRIFRWSLVGALLMVVYGFLASFGVTGFIGSRFSEGQGAYRFQGSIGNSSYVAAYLIFGLFYATYLLITKYKKKFLSLPAVTLYVVIGIFLVTFYLAQTRGAFVGLILSVIAFLGYFAFSHKAWRKWLLSIVAAVIVIAGTFIYFKDTTFIKSLPGSRIFDITFSAETFKDRAIMWKTAIDGLKDRPIFGWGPENFIQVFDRHFNIAYYKPPADFGAWFDRAHSIYFDYLVETGIIGLGSYLAIFIVFYWLLFKRKNESTANDMKLTAFHKAWLFALPLAYLVQGIVLFDVFPMYINNFLFFAFAVYLLSRADFSMKHELNH